MKPGKFLDYVIPLILLVVQLYTLYLINTTNYVVNNDSKFYIGIGAVLSSIVIMRFNPRIGKLITLAVLVAGLFGWIVFTSTRTVFSTNIFFGIEYRLEFLSLGLLLLFTILNFRSLKRYLKWLLQEESNSTP
ncbi:hypothetical protein L3C95_32725 [Chitinophaga filiformis]|uniref:hypothetical protein n=1 Tax=Chitinophaga filiformis TaxID=104663 RepID=UPI001F315711|nr:hypothetical protein [Chitinophaga filiformis]MCF6407596.1 hypothetical protein [Chitinophaga filiformis]MCF6407699.1 hypothetical protein [Chitinophaga filiformis]